MAPARCVNKARSTPSVHLDTRTTFGSFHALNVQHGQSFPVKTNCVVEWLVPDEKSKRMCTRRSPLRRCPIRCDQSGRKRQIGVADAQESFGMKSQHRQASNSNEPPTIDIKTASLVRSVSRTAVSPLGTRRSRRLGLQAEHTLGCWRLPMGFASFFGAPPAHGSDGEEFVCLIS